MEQETRQAHLAPASLSSVSLAYDSSSSAQLAQWPGELAAGSANSSANSANKRRQTRASGLLKLHLCQQCGPARRNSMADAATDVATGPPAHARRDARAGQLYQVESDILNTSLCLARLETKLARLAARFRKTMNFYGLIEDVTLLMVEPGGAHASRQNLDKIIWFSLALLANCLTVYVLVAHFIWELRRLDAKIAAHSKQQQPASSPSNSAIGSFNGWSLLKDFLENLRRHLSRLFALALVLIWYRNCHQIERLFIDCRRYYTAFYRSALLYSSSLKSADQVAQAKEMRQQLLEATHKFYKLARHRVNLAIVFPFAHLLFNLLAVLLFPVAVIVSNNGELQEAVQEAVRNQEAARNQTPAPSDPSGLVHSVGNLMGQALDNFNTFHVSIHTAFHPFDHQIYTDLADRRRERPISQSQSQAYCLVELFVYYIYIHGPRIVCATCLSLVLAIHHQCLQAFNRQLVALIRRARERPLTSADMIRLLKQYDMIGMMHARIERTFKWSLVLWFSLMFVSCLMQIFTLTESTSAVFGGSLVPGNKSAAPTNGQLVGPPSLLASTSPIAIMLARIVFVCYSPWLIYTEAFKIESESLKTSQLIMSLARRQDDPVAQSIEPNLFEPIYLGVGAYFHLNKKSVASLLGAIVTFSVMFIGELCCRLTLAYASWRTLANSLVELDHSPISNLVPRHQCRVAHQIGANQRLGGGPIGHSAKPSNGERGQQRSSWRRVRRAAGLIWR